MFRIVLRTQHALAAQDALEAMKGNLYLSAANATRRVLTVVVRHAGPTGRQYLEHAGINVGALR